MQVNLNTAQKTQLFEKTLGNVIKGGTRLKGANRLSVRVPNNTATYDFVSGIGKKGKFQYYAFKNAAGKVLQNYTRYITDNGSVKDVITDIKKTKRIFNTKRRTVNHGFLNVEGKFSPRGHLEQTEYSSMFVHINSSNKERMFSRNFLTTTPHGDSSGFELLQQACKPVGINCKFDWKGVPQIEYKNTMGKTIDFTETEAMRLPFIFRKDVLIKKNGVFVPDSLDFIPNERMLQKIGLAQKIQEKEHDIEGIMPRANAVKTKDLHLMKTSGMTPEEYYAKTGFLPKGEHLGNGQISIASDTKEAHDGVYILYIMSHEMQHAADIIHTYRGGQEASEEALKNLGINAEEWNKLHEEELSGLNQLKYMEKIIKKKGIAKKGTPEYDEAVKLYEMNYRMTSFKEFTSQEHHDAQDLEQRAIQAEKDEMTKMADLSARISKFIVSFIKTV